MIFRKYKLQNLKNYDGGQLTTYGVFSWGPFVLAPYDTIYEINRLSSKIGIRLFPKEPTKTNKDI